MLDGDPCVIVENEFVKPGKGQAFNRVQHPQPQDRPHASSAPSSPATPSRRADVVDVGHAVPLQRRRLLALHGSGELRAAAPPTRPPWATTPSG
ncbi:MAG: hypothetical protein MZW92_51100 [Comamonadaceae bacterium]|nr:hypothetical protein [Comamonadaceae bacterium]